jgi:hypothetical protein
MFPEDEVSTALEAVKESNKAMTGQMLATSLLERLCPDNNEKMEVVPLGVDRSDQVRLRAARIL